MDNDRPVEVFDYPSLLGEGPVWDHKSKSIFWVDIVGGKIHRHVESGDKYEFLELGEMIGCISLTSDGDLIAGIQNGIVFIDRVTGERKLIGDPESHMPGNRFNDGKCDPAGRFWAGTMSIKEEPNKGSLYMIDHDGSITKMISDVTISNGIAWSMDNKTLYYIDTPTKEVVAFDFDMASGKIKNKKAVIRIPEEEGFPDGMTIDTEGMLWIAHWDGAQVSRWDPSTGEKLFHFSLPTNNVTSCTFGGDKLDDLYITTARDESDFDNDDDDLIAGSLMVIRNCGFTGLPAVEFVKK